MPKFRLDDLDGLGSLTAAVNGFGFDTGSAQTIISMDDKLCSGVALANKKTKIHYGDSKVVGYPVLNPMTLFGITHRPICGNHLPPQEGRGRVGLSPSPESASIVHHGGVGGQRVVLDRTAESLCFGSDCGAAVHPPGARKLVLTPPPTGTVMGRVTVAPESPGAPWRMYDTGATYTTSINVHGVPMCVIGYNDIEYLDANFDTNTLIVRANGDACQSMDMPQGRFSPFL